MTTIRDIAKLSGVSVATVSRILNNSGKVSQETRAIVEKVISETGYHPNQVARTLYHKKSKMIGIIIPDLSNNFYTKIIDGIQELLQSNGYSALISFGAKSDTSKYLQFIKNFEDNNIDGIISSSFDVPSDLRINCPLVIYDSADIQDDFIRVCSDNKKGGRISADMISKKADRVLIQHWPLTLPTVCERIEATVNELKNLGIAYVLQEVSELNPAHVAQELFAKTLDFDAIITVNDIYAAEIIREAQKKNLHIPDDFQLVGYDNNILCEYTTPTISTIDQQPEKIGYYAAKSLLSLINGEKSSDNIIVDVVPIKRKTTK